MRGSRPLPRSVVTFLLVAFIGVLFIGCTPSEPDTTFEEFTFTDNDLQRVEELTEESETDLTITSSAAGDGMMMSETSASEATLLVEEGSTASTGSPSSSVTVTLNTEKQRQYDSLRAGSMSAENAFKVNNAFLNVRSSMSTTASQVARLVQGETVIVLEIPNADWAKIRLADGKEGYVSLRYIAKLTTDQKLAAEKAKYQGKYFVNFDFLNIRREPSQQAEKIGELPGKAIVTPLSISGEWAKVSFQGMEGYVSSTYLKEFLPSFVVRQEEYSVPVLQYRAGDAASLVALSKQAAAVKAAGKKVVTLSALKDLLLAQESRDVRMAPNTVILTVSGVNGKNAAALSDALKQAGVSATIFLAGSDIGLSGVTEKMILNLMANGNEIQSEGQLGDDLRSLTDSQLLVELSESKRVIEAVTKREVYAIAYPQGGVNDRVMRKAAEVGYLFGLTQAPDRRFVREQLLRLPSLFINSTMTPEEVASMVQ